MDKNLSGVGDSHRRAEKRIRLRTEGSAPNTFNLGKVVKLVVSDIKKAGIVKIGIVNEWNVSARNRRRPDIVLRPSIHPPSTIPALRTGQAREAGVEGLAVFFCRNGRFARNVTIGNVCWMDQKWCVV